MKKNLLKLISFFVTLFAIIANASPIRTNAVVFSKSYSKEKHVEYRESAFPYYYPAILIMNLDCDMSSDTNIFIPNYNDTYSASTDISVSVAIDKAFNGSVTWSAVKGDAVISGVRKQIYYDSSNKVSGYTYIPVQDSSSFSIANNSYWFDYLSFHGTDTRYAKMEVSGGAKCLKYGYQLLENMDFEYSWDY